MRRISLWNITLVGLLGLLAAVPVAHAQLQLVAQKAVLADTTITPPDPTVLTPTPIDSPEIFAFDVRPIPSSAYVLFTSSAVWEVNFTADVPLRANFQLRFNLTSPALPAGIILRFGVPLIFFRNNNGTRCDGHQPECGFLCTVWIAEQPLRRQQAGVPETSVF